MSFRNIGEGGKITDAECIISKRMRTRGGFIYKITDGENELEFESDSFFEAGQGLRVSGETYNDRGFLKLKTSSIEKIEGAHRKILEKAEAGVHAKELPFLVQNEIMDGLRPQITTCAKKLLAAKKMGRHILLRFHNDADGIIAALAITRILRAYTSQQNSATYAVYDAMRDIGNLQGEKNPIVLLLDFGSGAESAEGLKILKASGAEIIIIDHHPNEGNAEENSHLFLNPWAISQNERASSHVAGYLAVEVARACGIQGVESLAPVACAGDKSTILPIDERDREVAIVLDYMATYSGFGNKLDFYKNALENKELYSSVLVQANEALDRITEDVKANMKKKLDGPVSVYALDTDRVKSREFPGKGKITTRGFELVGDAPAVVLGTWKNGLSFRINDGGIRKGVRADEIISMLKQEMPDFIDGGGGHARAASLRIREGFVDSVVGKIIEKVKEKH
jgi:RecJ-like exonuclease